MFAFSTANDDPPPLLPLPVYFGQVPEVRLLVLVREPVQRAYSEHQMKVWGWGWRWRDIVGVGVILFVIPLVEPFFAGKKTLPSHSRGM